MLLVSLKSLISWMLGILFMDLAYNCGVPNVHNWSGGIPSCTALLFSFPFSFILLILISIPLSPIHSHSLSCCLYAPYHIHGYFYNQSFPHCTAFPTVQYVQSWIFITTKYPTQLWVVAIGSNSNSDHIKLKRGVSMCWGAQCTDVTNFLPNQ